MKEEKVEEGEGKFVFCNQLPLEALVERGKASYIFVEKDFFSLKESFPLREKTFMVRVEERKGKYFAFIEIHAGEIILISPREFTFLIEDDIILD